MATDQAPVLDQAHVARIQAVLEALPENVELARLMLACEDAYVALGLGVSCGLTLAQVRTQHAALVAETKPRTVPDS